MSSSNLHTSQQDPISGKYLHLCNPPITTDAYVDLKYIYCDYSIINKLHKFNFTNVDFVNSVAQATILSRDSNVEYIDQAYAKLTQLFPNVDTVKVDFNLKKYKVKTIKDYLSIPYVKKLSYQSNTGNETNFEMSGLIINIYLYSYEWLEGDKIGMRIIDTSFKIKKTKTFRKEDLNSLFIKAEDDELQLVLDLNGIKDHKVMHSITRFDFSKYIKKEYKLEMITSKDYLKIVELIDGITHRVSVNLSIISMRSESEENENIKHLLTSIVQKKIGSFDLSLFYTSDFKWFSKYFCEFYEELSDNCNIKSIRIYGITEYSEEFEQLIKVHNNTIQWNFAINSKHLKKEHIEPFLALLNYDNNKVSVKIMFNSTLSAEFPQFEAFLVPKPIGC